MTCICLIVVNVTNYITAHDIAALQLALSIHITSSSVSGKIQYWCKLAIHFTYYLTLSLVNQYKVLAHPSGF